jgi:hypothetical protein
MKPVDFKQSNIVLGKNQPEYLDLPVFTNDEMTVSCWKLTWRERLKLLFTGRLWLTQLNFSQPLQPQAPTVDSVFEE